MVLPQLKADWLCAANYGTGVRDPMRKLDLPSSSIVCPIKCSVEPDSRFRQAVHPRCGAAVERRLFGCRRASGNSLESVPQLGVAAGLLVRREVLLHRPVTPAQSRDRPMRRTQRNAAHWKYLRRGDFPLTSAGMGPIKVRGRDEIERWVIRGPISLAFIVPRRRYACSGAGARPRPNPDWAIMGVCPRGPAVLWSRAAGCGLLLQPRPRRRASSGPSRALHGLSASRCLKRVRVRCTSRGRPVRGSPLLWLHEVALLAHGRSN
jgi:hypothetical protein